MVVITLILTTKIEIADSAFFNEIYRTTVQNDDATISRYDTFTVAVLQRLQRRIKQ